MGTDLKLAPEAATAAVAKQMWRLKLESKSKQAA